MALFSERMGYSESKGFGRVRKLKEGLPEWDRDKLERFVQTGFFHFKRQISAKLNAYSFNDKYGRKAPDTIKEEIHDAVMEELLVLSELLIVLALEERILDRSALGTAEVERKARSVFITTEEDGK